MSFAPESLLRRLRTQYLWAVVCAALFLTFLGVLLGYSEWYGNLIANLGAALLGAWLVVILAIQRDAFFETIVGLGIEDVFADRKARFTNRDWDQLLRDTSSSYRVLGVANHGYIRHEAVKQATEEGLRMALNKGVGFEFLWLDPFSKRARNRALEEGRSIRRDTTQAISWFWQFRQGLEPAHRNRLRLRIHDSTPTCGITWSDDTLIVTHYLAGELNQTAPGMVLRYRSGGLARLLSRLDRGYETSLAKKYQDNLTEVSGNARDIDAAFMERLRTHPPKDPAGLPSEAEIAAEEEQPSPEGGNEKS